MARLGWVCWSIAVSAAGCIAVPIPHGSTRFEHSRRAIDAAATRPVEPGVTRERVLLLLGEPDHVFDDDGRAMAWHWVTCEWTIFWAAGGAGRAASGTIDLPNNHFLMVVFDGRGVVARRDVRGDTPFERVSERELSDYVNPRKDE